MLSRKTTLKGLIFLGFILIGRAIGQADIYVWTDTDGTIHLQNTTKPKNVVTYYTYSEKKPDVHKGRQTQDRCPAGRAYGYGGAALPKVWGSPLSTEDRIKLVRYTYDRGIRY